MKQYAPQLSRPVRSAAPASASFGQPAAPRALQSQRSDDQFGARAPTGHPLDTATRSFMEPRFGHDFSQVRVRTDADAARSHQARAFTQGSAIVFDADAYAPASLAGRRLLAHELAHVVQQKSAPPSAAARVSAPHDRAEIEAAAAADAVMAGRSRIASTLHGAPVGIYREGPGPTLKGKREWAAAEAAPKRDPLADPNAHTVMPSVVEGASWSADDMLKAAAVEAANPLGAAIKAGKAAVSAYAKRLYEKFLADFLSFDDTYGLALFEATMFCDAMVDSLAAGSTTYGSFARFGALTKLLGQTDEQRLNSITAWTGRPKPPPLQGAALKAAEADAATAFHSIANEIKAAEAARKAAGGQEPERHVESEEEFAKQKPANFRQAIIAQLDYFKGAKEEFGEANPKSEAGKRFAKFRDAAALKTARINQNYTNAAATFTTCIEFQGDVVATSVSKLNLIVKGKFDNNWFNPQTRPTLIEGTAAQNEAAQKAHPVKAEYIKNPESAPQSARIDPENVAWHYGSPGMTERPVGGDVILFSFAYDQAPATEGGIAFSKGMFSHMGVLRQITRGKSRTITETIKAGQPIPPGSTIVEPSAPGAPVADTPAIPAATVTPAKPTKPNDIVVKRDVVYEDWVTVDGGGGLGTKLDTTGKLKAGSKAGSEEVNENHRLYFPDTNLIAGEPNQDGPNVKLRHVYGWVDVDKLV